MTTSPDLERRMGALELQVKILQATVQQLQEQLRRPPTAKEVLAEEKERRYEELERALDDLYDLTYDPNAELTPTQIVADLERSGLKMSAYGATDHARKVVLGRILRGLNVVPTIAEGGGRAYPIRRKAQ